MRALGRRGASALLLLGMMVLGSVGLWVGVPLAWLWIASRIQAATDSLGAGIGVAFLGVSVTILGIAVVLSKLSQAYRRSRVERGLDDTGNLALEVVVVVSAVVAATAFVVWFFFLSGAAPFGAPHG